MLWCARSIRFGRRIGSNARRDPTMADGPQKTPRREIYVEFVVQGAYVKATAIDGTTGLEASIVGPATAPRDALGAAALRKLEYVRNHARGGA